MRKKRGKERKMREKINKKRKQKKERKKRGRKGALSEVLNLTVRRYLLKGRLLDVQIPFLFRHWPKMGFKRASESILGRFGKGLGRIFGAHGRVWGRFSFIFWLPLGRFVQEAFDMIWGGF